MTHNVAIGMNRAPIRSLRYGRTRDSTPSGGSSLTKTNLHASPPISTTTSTPGTRTSSTCGTTGSSLSTPAAVRLFAVARLTSPDMGATIRVGCDDQGDVPGDCDAELRAAVIERSTSSLSAPRPTNRLIASGPSTQARP